MMKIAVLSGKGGTGKTTVATNLAYSLYKSGKKVQLLDADAEEPNSHIFFDVEYEKEESVDILIPKIDRNVCTHCGECARACEFSAISVSKKHIMVFEYLCHGCGVCSMVCPVKAISEEPKSIGKVRLGETKEGILFGEGILNIGEPSAVRIIRQMKKHMDENSDVIVIDSPPGTSCPVVETLQDVDFALLVTEPTPFGLHDLKLSVNAIKELNIPMGVVINRYDGVYTEVEKYLEAENIPLMMKIPYDVNIARSYSNGRLFSKDMEEYVKKFGDLYDEIEAKIKC
jgi:MinD superfamily P-loop ATPase